jgi:pSer/pThr/pTyr-binding forkhead associated (FHA) protein
MRLRYTKRDGTQMEFELGERPVTIGRSPEADVVVLDEKASRIHCGIRLWDGEFYIKDLKSRNGTYVNDQRVEVATLKPGDIVRVGSVLFLFVHDTDKDSGVALQEVESEMAQGKGYSTILKQIVGDLGESDAQSTPKSTESDAEAPIPVKIRRAQPSS